jgi:hypothetical protein
MDFTNFRKITCVCSRRKFLASIFIIAVPAAVAGGKDSAIEKLMLLAPAAEI